VSSVYILIWFGVCQFVSRNLELSSRNRQLEAELRALHQADDAADAESRGEAAAPRREKQRRLLPSRGGGDGDKQRITGGDASSMEKVRLQL
jgi:hypothetical protein